MRAIFSCVFLSIVKMLFSANIGNLSTPALLQEGILLSDERWFNFRIGYEQTFIEDRKLKFAKRIQNQGFSIEKVTGMMNLATFAFNIKERFDICSKFGEAYYFPLFTQYENQYEFLTNFGGYYYGGFRLALWEVKNTTLGFEGGYGFFRSSTKFFYENKHPIQGIDFGLFSREWFINVGIAHKMSYFIPYFGVSICDIKAKVKRTHFFNKKQLRLNDREKAGFFLGFSFTRASFFFLNAEARFYNERSYSLSGEIRF